MAEPAETIGPGQIRRAWPAQARYLVPLRSEIRSWLAPLALTEDAEDDIVYAVNEAVSNCMEHAYRPASVDDTVDVRFWSEPPAVFIEIVDHGRWQTPAGGATRRGRGIVMMQQLMGGVEIHHDRRGTRVLLCQPLPSAPHRTLPRTTSTSLSG